MDAVITRELLVSDLKWTTESVKHFDMPEDAQKFALDEDDSWRLEKLREKFRGQKTRKKLEDIPEDGPLPNDQNDDRGGHGKKDKDKGREEDPYGGLGRSTPGRRVGKILGR